MRKTKRGQLTSRTVLTLVIACAPFTTVSAQANRPKDSDLPLVGVRWQAIELKGKPVRDEDSDLYFTLKQVRRFNSGSTGRLVSPSSDGCNDLAGIYELDRHSLHIYFTTSTLLACAPPPVPIGNGKGIPPTRPVDEPKLFIEVLRQTASFKIRSSVLELLNKNGEVLANLTANQD